MQKSFTKSIDTMAAETLACLIDEEPESEMDWLEATLEVALENRDYTYTACLAYMIYQIENGLSLAP